MSKARLVITALFVERQTPAEIALRYGVHRAWVHKLNARYLAEGEAAFEPRSRRPKTSPRAAPPAMVELVLRLRKQLAERGLDAGADTIEWHLQHLHHIGIGRTHARTHVILLAQDLHIRVVDAATGELLRDLILDPTKDYQPTGRPPGPAPKSSR
jgi:hypothetical protein